MNQDPPLIDGSIPLRRWLKNAIDLSGGTEHDLVFLEKLLELKAQQWFEQREQFQRDHPGTKSFVSWYWELVPGQPLLTQKLEFDSGARAVVVFANYFSEGQHRVRADAHQDLVIRLGKDDVTLEPKS